jgi:nucleotidyltransferase substrate binding protein (TIGR01987 family)
LEEALDLYRRDMSQTVIRDGPIERFECTCEIAYKILKRYLEATSPSPEKFERMPFADPIGAANEQDLLLGDWPRWRRYREMRAKTSHTYDEPTALDVVAGIDRFLDETRFCGIGFPPVRPNERPADRCKS